MSQNSKLIIYAERSFLPLGKQPAILLYPFWNHSPFDSNDPDCGRFDEYIKHGKALFEIVENPELADIFLLPFEFSFEAEELTIAKGLAKKAKGYGKKMLVFFNSDDDRDINLDNVIVFRTSFYKSSRRMDEHAFPGWSIDFMSLKAMVADGERHHVKPSISYCGYVDYLTNSERFSMTRIKNKLIKKRSFTEEIGPRIRGKAIRTLLKNPGINTNFIIRNGFWAPGMDKRMARQEYVNNIFQSDYALIARGGGNFSYRLYEVLSCGRIPVFINTDCVLPFDTFVDWKKYVVWIEESEIGLIAERLIEYHQQLTADQMEQKKRDCRWLYETWLSPQAYFSNIYRYLG